MVELRYHADKGGTFVMWSNIAWALLAAQFVPDPDNTEDEWHEPGTPTAIDQTENSSVSQKVLRNGRIIILRNNRAYDLSGCILQHRINTGLTQD